jgi:hypothetical protein
MEAALADPAGGQRWVIYNEAWRLMAYPALLRRMDAEWRLARHFGIANMLVFHKLSDLDNVGDSGSAMRALASSLLANAETRVVSTDRNRISSDPRRARSGSAEPNRSCFLRSASVRASGG